MNRNFFVADPDAFTVSTQTVDDQSWHGGQRQLSLEEAKVSIALSAVAGGMFELGDDLPTLGASQERLSLVKNSDILDMAHLGHSSIPTDLMTYAASDLQPSIFLLKEAQHQSILTIFNWTEGELKRAINLTSLGLKETGSYKITEVFGDQSCCTYSSDTINLVQPAHSVRMLKLIDNSVPAAPPAFEVQSPTAGKAGETLAFSGAGLPNEAPVLTYHWDFGDGSAMDGKKAQHAYTHAGEYDLHVTATGLDASANSKDVKIKISGNIATRFVPADKKRPE
jgi:hypothetical protein